MIRTCPTCGSDRIENLRGIGCLRCHNCGTVGTYEAFGWSRFPKVNNKWTAADYIIVGFLLIIASLTIWALFACPLLGVNCTGGL